MYHLGFTVSNFKGNSISLKRVNMILFQNLHHHYRSLGGWTFAFSPYYDTNFTKNLDNPATQKMAQIIDPLGV